MTASVRRVTRGRSRPGSANSPDRWLAASQPANAKNSTEAADPTEDQPPGRNGVKWRADTCGAAASTVHSSTAASSPPNSSCTRPDSRSPTAFEASDPASTAPATAAAPVPPQPAASATYFPPIQAAETTPIGTAP